LRYPPQKATFETPAHKHFRAKALKKILFILLCFFFARIHAAVTDRDSAQILVMQDEIITELVDRAHARPLPLLEKIRQKKARGKKLTAALLAFPFPCGIVGLHRIYLGSAPYVPIVYIATLGGALGILPFIDFCVLLIDKDLEPYIGNDKVFMWVN
jgi:TM2 domain-containing membrane protein YozV